MRWWLLMGSVLLVAVAPSCDDATGGSGGNGGTGTETQCPPCAAPPDFSCVGSGPCGCGPYTCPTACGDQSCPLEQYCQYTPGTGGDGGDGDGGDGQTADSYLCLPLPDGCGSTPTCSCLTEVPCGDNCEAPFSGGLQLACPASG